MTQVLDLIGQAEQGGTLRVLAYLEATLDARRRWNAFGPLLSESRGALVIFEAWNVAVIALSLLGCNFMRWLTDAAWVAWALLLIVAGTAFVTMYCVVVWTRGIET